MPSHAYRTHRSFGDRLRLARSRRNEDWWSIVFGGPIAQILTALLADVGWITPNRITWLSFLAKLAALPFLLDGSAAGAIAAIALLQANVVLDCMDGTLARLRGSSSALGAYLDKVTDAVGMLAVMGAFGARTLRETGDGWAPAIALAGAGLWLARIYAYWVIAFYERQERVPRPTSGGEQRLDFGPLRFGQRLRYYASSTWRLLLVSEADVYLWLSVALATGWLRPIAYLIGGGLVLHSAWLLVLRGRRAAQVDAWARRER